MTRIIIEIDGKEASSIILHPSSAHGTQTELAASALTRSDTDAGGAPTEIAVAFSEATALSPTMSATIDAGPSRERPAAAEPSKRPRRK